MKPTRILLLLVALMAGGLAAYLATRGSSTPEPVVAETRPEPQTQVLVASAPIGVGERLSAGKLAWQAWPEAALRPEYITSAKMPDATSELAGTVARFEFFSGEPIRSEKLVRTEQGYLSAVLSQGMRGVSINVTAESGAGGFIVPNDRVDVVLTHGGGTGEVSETILQNVKVLAIGKRLGETGTTGSQADADKPAGQGFEGGTIATLELDPAQGETLINAQSLGRLSLALRSIVDFSQKSGADGRSNRNQPIRVIRYGTETSIISGTSRGASGAAPADSASPATAQPNPVISAPKTVTPDVAPAQSEGEPR